MRMAERKKCPCGRLIICSCGGCASDTCKLRCKHERSSGALASTAGKLGERWEPEVRGHRKGPAPTLSKLDGDYDG